MVARKVNMVQGYETAERVTQLEWFGPSQLCYYQTGVQQVVFFHVFSSKEMLGNFPQMSVY